MEKNQMRNIIILKNLPSNLVEEAIVVIKSGKVAKRLEYIDKKTSSKEKSNRQSDYIFREAEMVVSNYIKSIEKREKKNLEKNKEKIYKNVKIYAIFVTIVLIISWLI